MSAIGYESIFVSKKIGEWKVFLCERIEGADVCVCACMRERERERERHEKREREFHKYNCGSKILTHQLMTNK